MPSDPLDADRLGTLRSNAAELEPFVLRSGQSQDFWQIGILWSILASGDRSGGAFTMMEQLMPKGSGPKPHVHERYHEYFYLLDGEIRYQIGDQLVTAGAGSTVSIPPGNVHAFAVVSETSRALNMYTPGGFDDRLKLTATPATSRSLPPSVSTGVPTAQQRQAFADRLAELHNERWDGVTPDLLADERP